MDKSSEKLSERLVVKKYSPRLYGKVYDMAQINAAKKIKEKMIKQ